MEWSAFDIQDDVLAEISCDPAVNIADIGVMVKAGRGTLTETLDNL